jgi:hypothetical protein
MIFASSAAEKPLNAFFIPATLSGHGVSPWG